MRTISVSIIVPIYEEEYDVASNIKNLILKLEELKRIEILSDYELLIAVSYQRCLELIKDANLIAPIKFIHCGDSLELGDIFVRGVQLARKEFVGLITPYNQVDLEFFGRIFETLRIYDYDMAVAYIGNYSARPWYRTVVSEANVVIVNILFGLRLKYYHLNFYRTSLIQKVVFTTGSHAAMVEGAVWMAKSGFKITQMSFRMIPHNFKSKSRVFRVENFIKIFTAYARLFWRIRILRKKLKRGLQ